MVIYQTELCNLKKNKSDAKIMSDIAYNCTFVNGRKGQNPMINAFYFKYHGTKEEYENAKKELKDFNKKRMDIANKLKKQAKSVSDDINRIVEYFYFLSIVWGVSIERKVNSANPITLYNNHDHGYYLA